jgi:hypothetical protein
MPLASTPPNVQNYACGARRGAARRTTITGTTRNKNSKEQAAMSDAGNNPYTPPPAGANPGGNPAQNPYAAPRAKVAQEVEMPIGGLIENGRRVEIGRGLGWISEGFAVFMQAPGMWMLICVVFFVLTIFLSAIPFLGGLALNVLMPVFGAGMMLACRILDQGGELDVSILFAGFKQHTGQLVVVGLLYLGGVVVVMVVVGVLIAVAIAGLGIAGSFKGDMAGIGLLGAALVAVGVLVMIALLLPMMMAIWFAPPLVVFHEQEPMAAMRQSFFGCLKNFLPFLLYSIALVPLSLIATLPVFLGWLVLGPVMIGGVYRSYQEIFVE